SEERLLGERETSELREQFIAVLGHDLRNPLASISAGTNLVRGSRDSAPILALMQQSVSRMSKLIDNLLDFARGRLGGGIALDRAVQPLGQVLDQVVAELRASFPANQIESHFDLTQPVDCDGGRIAQLLSNLLGNALIHGTAESPVRIHASTREGQFELSVANAGQPIAPEAIQRLFQPFYRVSDDARQGLGLGLYIASEIACAHGGTLEATSSADETRFTFRMTI
ncbi:MAG: PAS domain-containing sensor histidine kinase, partial [Bradyrhizobium sp.]|nr:PAS domain-containing sensor histidine kinase [Bradyrhizobium sp.]